MYIIMERKFKQWWSTIQPISTKQKKTMTYHQAVKCPIFSLFFSPLPTFSCIRAKIPVLGLRFLYFPVLGLRFLYFPIFQYKKEKEMDSESCGLSSWYWLFISVMGGYEKQQCKYIIMYNICTKTFLYFYCTTCTNMYCTMCQCQYISSTIIVQ